MPHIRFTVHADCDSQEPCRIVPALRGEIFEFAGESDNEIRIGQIDAHLVLRGRALNEQESLFEAMDSIDSSVFECYEALFDPETDDWNQSVQDLYKGQIMGLDVLFIESINSTRIIGGKESLTRAESVSSRAGNDCDFRNTLRTDHLQVFSLAVFQLGR